MTGMVLTDIHMHNFENKRLQSITQSAGIRVLWREGCGFRVQAIRGLGFRV